MMQKLGQLSGKIFGDRRILLFLICANMLGFCVGMYYYWPQLMASSPALWMVIIDSPLSVLMMAAVCTLFYFRKKVPDAFKLLTAAYLVQYGLFTVFAISLYWHNYAVSIDPMDPVIGIINFILHSGMIVEGVFLVPQMKPKIRDYALVLAILLVNDYFDYFLDTVTRVPDTYKGFLMIESFAATFVIVFSAFICLRGRNRKP